MKPNKRKHIYPLLTFLAIAAASLSCTSIIPSPEITNVPQVPERSIPTPERLQQVTEQSGPEIPPQSEKAATPSSQQPVEQPSSGILLEDDFSSSTSGWEIGDFDGGSVGYDNGAYFVESIMDDSLMWGLASKVFEDTDITVETQQLFAPGNDNNGYGLMCRVQPNDDGYILRISGDGYAAIQYFQEGELYQLVEWFETPHINLGNARNIIRAVCDGPNLALYVNDVLVAEAVDSNYSRGDIALAATSFESEPTRVLFDNIRVSLPQP